MSKTRTTTIVTLRLVTVEERITTDEEPPSLTAIPVEGEEVTETKARPPVKASPYFPWARKAGGS